MLVRYDKPVYKLKQGFSLFSDEGRHSTIYIKDGELLKLLNFKANKYNVEQGVLNKYDSLIYFSEINDRTFIVPKVMYEDRDGIVAYTMEMADGQRFDYLNQDSNMENILTDLDALKNKVHEILSERNILMKDVYFKNIYYGNTGFQIADFDAFAVVKRAKKFEVMEHNKIEMGRRLFTAFSQYCEFYNFRYFIKKHDYLLKMADDPNLTFDKLIDLLYKMIKELEKEVKERITTIGDFNKSLSEFKKNK